MNQAKNDKTSKTQKFSVFKVPSKGERFFNLYFKSLLDYDKSRVSSVEERKEKQQDRVGYLTYGEVTFESMEYIMQFIQNYRLEQEGEEAQEEKKQDVFYDLGSGSGRPVFSSACLSSSTSISFRKCVGIEILESLYSLSISTQAESKTLLAEEGDLSPLLPEIEFINGSIFDLELCDWTLDATIVLANSTCFSLEMIEQLSEMGGKKLIKGSYFVTLTHVLNPKYFELISTQRLEMSWGQADVCFHIRL